MSATWRLRKCGNHTTLLGKPKFSCIATTLDPVVKAVVGLLRKGLENSSAMLQVVPRVANLRMTTETRLLRMLDSVAANQSPVGPLRKVVNATGAAAANFHTARFPRNRNSHAGTFNKRDFAVTVRNARSAMERTAHQA